LAVRDGGSSEWVSAYSRSPAASTRYPCLTLGFVKPIRGGLLSGVSARLLLLARFPAVLVASLMLVSGAQAAAGDPDPSFSGDGKQRTDFGAGFSGATAAVRQGDGKIVAVGTAGGNFLVARYNLDGSLDPNFSGDGRVQTNFTGADFANDVALQGNKIVVVGLSTANNGFGYFALARYNSDGSLDRNFSGDGKQTTLWGGSGEGGAFGAALQSDGKIVAVGTTNIHGSHTLDFALARYRLNGSLDPSFSGDGKQTLDLAFGEFAEAHGVAIQADGKIIAVGDSFDFAGFALARFNPNGSLDTSFSGDGLQTTDFGVGAVGRKVALQSDGKIVAVGRAGGDFALARYNPGGSLDTSFSGDGLQTTDFLFGFDDRASDVAIQANGRIVAVGIAGGGATFDDFGLARYNTNGSLDPSFSGDGRKRTSFAGPSVIDEANGVALQGDGRIVAVGVGNDEFALARYVGG
jgi:uncharacterized delta-60 repeat protein